jgi:hypothetical protein
MEPVEPTGAAPGQSDDAELAALVAERAAAIRAEYPAGLELSLDEHWQRTRSRPDPTAALNDLRTSADRAAAFRFARPEIEMSSSLPGGAQVHRLVSRTVDRYVADLVDQLDAYTTAVSACLRAIVTTIAEPAHLHPELVGQLESVEGQLAELRARFDELPGGRGVA